jgi:hypothetical protein
MFLGYESCGKCMGRFRSAISSKALIVVLALGFKDLAQFLR